MRTAGCSGGQAGQGERASEHRVLGEARPRQIGARGPLAVGTAGHRKEARAMKPAGSPRGAAARSASESAVAAGPHSSAWEATSNSRHQSADTLAWPAPRGDGCSRLSGIPEARSCVEPLAYVHAIFHQVGGGDQELGGQVRRT